MKNNMITTFINRNFILTLGPKGIEDYKEAMQEKLNSLIQPDLNKKERLDRSKMLKAINNSNINLK